jgi:hypothetical protein
VVSPKCPESGVYEGAAEQFREGRLAQGFRITGGGNFGIGQGKYAPLANSADRQQRFGLK